MSPGTVSVAELIINDLKMTKYYAGGGGGSVSGVGSVGGSGAGASKYAADYPEELRGRAAKAAFYDRAQCLDLCFEKRWNEKMVDCPWKKLALGEDVFREGWQGRGRANRTDGLDDDDNNDDDDDGSDCDPVKTSEGRFLPLPAAELCSSTPPPCFRGREAEQAKEGIATGCLALCKRSNYEEEFSMRFDVLTDEEIKQTYFYGQELPNKTSIRTEMR